MRRILQKFDFRSSVYARPNQTWTCGREADGSPCSIGPDAKGGCQADFECHPVKRGDRWHCTRSDMSGGRCDHGPLPDGTCCKPVPRCRPVMNWRARPGAMARRVAGLTFGLLLILMAGSGPAFINPGPLTFQHTAIQDCAGCHTAFDKGPTSWVHAAFAEKAVVADSKRCIVCHDLGDNNLLPHALPTTRIAKISRTVNPPSPGTWPALAASASVVFARSKEGGAALGCMTCHQEHQGNAADLSAISSAQCQVCHSAQFSSLSDGHPEFKGYPFKRRTRIQFDHTSHIGKHFRDKAVQASAPKKCKTCHTPDRSGLMLAVGFDDGCAACHESQTRGAGRATAKGIGVFNVPGLDVETLEKRGVDIGDWPEDADEEMTPFMAFLLAGGNGYGAIKKTLAGLDLLDLADANETQITAARDLAWRIKELFLDISLDGVSALKARLEKSLGRALAQRDLVGLSGLLPVDTVRSAEAHWFVDLFRDVARYRLGPPSAAGNDAGDKDDKNGGDLLAGDKDDKNGGDLLAGDKDDKDGAKDSPKTNRTRSSGEDWSEVGGWYLDEFILRYRPVGHGDGFVKAWLDVTGRSTGGPGESAGRRIFESLADAKSPGLCAKCHSVDASEAKDEKALAVNWPARHPVLGEKPFTAFFHTAHFSLLGEKGCLTCHALDTKTAYAQSFKDNNPATFASNFGPVEREKCAECHTPEEAADNCLICHNYHISTFPSATPSTAKMM